MVITYANELQTCKFQNRLFFRTKKDVLRLQIHMGDVVIVQKFQSRSLNKKFAIEEDWRSVSHGTPVVVHY